MSLTYGPWSIALLRIQDATPLTQVVVQIMWSVTVTDENGNTAIYQDATTFNPLSVDPENFITFNSLTEDIILGWIQTKIESDIVGKNLIEFDIRRKIQNQLNPVTEIDTGNFPWIPT